MHMTHTNGFGGMQRMEFRILNVFDTAILFGLSFYNDPDDETTFEINIFLIFLVLQFRFHDR